jgi:hypothetical protein
MGSELAFPFMHLFYLIEGLLYLLFGKGLATLGALVNHISQFIINKLVGKIDVMKPDREIVDALEVLSVHSSSHNGPLVFTSSFPFLQ